MKQDNNYDDDFKYCIQFLSGETVEETVKKVVTNDHCAKCGSYNVLREHLSGQPFYVVCGDCGVMEMDNIVSCKEFKEHQSSVNRIVLPYSRKVYLKRKIRFRLGLQNVLVPKELVNKARIGDMNIKDIRVMCDGDYKRFKRHACKIWLLAHGKRIEAFPDKLFDHLCFFMGHFERYYTPTINRKKFINVDYFALKLMQWMYQNCCHQRLGYNPEKYRFLFKRAICQSTKDRNSHIWKSVEADHIFSHFLSLYKQDA